MLERDPAPRKRMHRREVVSGARFLTFSCFGQMMLLKTGPLRDVVAEAIGEARDKHRFRLIAWVVMPEHAHLLIVPRPIVRDGDGGQWIASRSTAEQALFTMKSSVSQRVLRRWIELRAPVLDKLRKPDGSHHFWLPGGGFDRNSRTGHEFEKTIAYIHENPVTRGLVDTPTDWVWSSARWYAGMREGTLRIDAGDNGREWEPPDDWVREAVLLGRNDL